MHRGLVILLIVSLSCSTTADRPAAQTISVARRVVPLSADTLWVRGGREGDRLLRYPEYLAHDATQLYLSDLALHQVIAVDPRTGRVLWNTATTGAAIHDPGSITGLPGGGVAVLDGSGSIVTLDARGKRRSEGALPDAPDVRQLCALDDSTFLIAVMRQHFPLAIVNSSGQTMRRLELPWPELSALPAMQTQLQLAGDAHGRCIIALVFGGGLASVIEQRVEWMAPYVERVAVPKGKTIATDSGGTHTVISKVGARHAAVRDLAVDDSVVAVIFEGAEGKPGSDIDEYDARTGAYLRTRSSERRVLGVQRIGGRYYFHLPLNGYAALVAQRAETRR